MKEGGKEGRRDVPTYGLLKYMKNECETTDIVYEVAKRMCRREKTYERGE